MTVGLSIRTLRATPFVVLLLGGCSAPTEETLPTRPVLASVADVRTEQVFGPFAGAIEPRFTTNQGFRTSGRMIARDVFVGDLVRKGQRLALLDKTLLAYAVTQARSGVSNAEAQLDNVEAAAERKRILARSQAVPQADVDSATADEKTAAAQRDQANAALKRARDNLGYAGLYSEYDGIVLSWNAEVGQDVAEGAAVVTLARPDVLEAVVDIPDDLIDRVRERETFTVALQSANGLTVKGIVREIAPSSEAATRTRRVRFTLQDPPFAFRIGGTVTVAFASPIPPRAEIPATAVIEKEGRTFVWVVAAGAETVVLRPIRIVDSANGVANVAGLADGDRVVRAGVNRIKEGQAAKVMASFAYP